MSPSATEPSTTLGRLDPRYLDSLFQGAGFAIIACRPDGHIVAGNRAARRLFGLGRSAFGGPSVGGQDDTTLFLGVDQ